MFPQVQEHTVPFGRTVMDFAGHVNRWIGSRQYDLGYSDGLSLAIMSSISPALW